MFASHPKQRPWLQASLEGQAGYTGCRHFALACHWEASEPTGARNSKYPTAVCQWAKPELGRKNLGHANEKLSSQLMARQDIARNGEASTLEKPRGGETPCWELPLQKQANAARIMRMPPPSQILTGGLGDTAEVHRTNALLSEHVL